MAKIGFPIDAVYTWVDGDDPLWRERKAAALAQQGADPGFLLADTGASRFRDNDELRYSLRSLERFAPWIRQVYLVTDQQCPPWIRRSRVRIVDHRDVFPEFACLPSFSSHAIELCIHRIEGLSEHFLSFNDDFFLGSRLTPSHFFTGTGAPLIRVARKGRRHRATLLSTDYVSMSPHTAGVTRARRLVMEHFGVYLPYQVRHYPRPMRRSDMERIWEQFEAEARTTLSHAFRTVDDVAIHALYAYFAVASGAGRARVINGPGQLARLPTEGIFHVATSIGDGSFDSKLRWIRLLKPKTFCINDKTGATEEQRERMVAFLDRLFPDKSEFET